MLNRCFFLVLGVSALLPTVSPAEELAPVATRSTGVAVARRTLNQDELTKALTPDGALQGWITRLESSISAGESNEFDAFLRSSWLLDAIMSPVHNQGHTVPADIEAAFTQGTRASWASRSLAVDYLGHQFRFLRVHSLGGRPGLLFRSAGDSGQLNYCLFSIATDQSGSLGAQDLYVVGMGEWLSDTLRRGYLTLVESLNPRGESGRRAGLYVDSLPRITEMQAALAQRDYPKVLALSSQLPTEVRQDRQILLTRLEAAEHTSLADRAKVFGEWKALHPNPEQLPLKWADFHIAAGRFSEARGVLATLNQRLGGDSYLMLRLGEIKMLANYHAAGQLIGPRPGPDAEAPERAENRP